MCLMKKKICVQSTHQNAINANTKNQIILSKITDGDK